MSLPPPNSALAGVVERAVPFSAAAALHEPDAPTWDAFVRQHAHGHLLQQRAWGTLKQGAGWQPQRLAVLAADGTLRAGAQVLYRCRFGLCVAYVPRGPLLAGDAALDGLLLAGLLRQARRRRAVFLRLEPNLHEDAPAASTLHSWLLLHGLRPAAPTQPHSTIQLDLTPPPERLFASFSKGHRADTRRAERQGVTVHVGTADDMDAFYALMQATSQRAAFGIHSAAYYRRAWELFQPASRLLLARHAGATVAAHLVFADQQCGYYLYSGATAAGLKTGANHLLAWHALQWARAQGCTRYDFWGIPDALGQAANAPTDAARAVLEAEARQDALFGVYRFKKGFGGSVVRFLPAYDYPLLPPLYWLWQWRARRAGPDIR